MNLTIFELSLSFLADYLKNTEFFQIIRKVVDPLFTICISSYIFEHYYFRYQWISLIDYKSILSFFVKGDFIIPSTIFLVVHFSINLLIGLIVNMVNKPVLSYMENAVPSQEERENYRNSPQKFDKIKKDFAKFEKNKFEVELTLHFFFKSIIVTVFYFCILPNYGVLLFIMMLIFLVLAVLAYWIMYFGITFVTSMISKLEHPENPIV